MIYKNILSVAGLSLLFMTPLAGAAVGGGSGTCYNCRMFAGSWSCDTLWSTSGGTACTAVQDSCTVSGNCRGGVGGLAAPLEMEAESIREVAEVNPGVALTLARLAQLGLLDAEMSMSWADRPVSQADVEKVLAGGFIRGEGSGRERIHQMTVDLLEDSTWMLVLTPAERSSDSGAFQRFSMLLEARNDSLIPTMWLFE
ncbi:MAG: hypothetical protein AAF725_10740 [Acidobacteriota bacterium]